MVKPGINLEDYLSKKVQVLGNLTKQANFIEVSEIIPLNSQTSSASPTTLTSPNSPSSSDPSAELPALYPKLSWETTQKRTLVFTSGKRKIEQEGVYLESSQINIFPQDFINYYIQEFKARQFKETLNSISPEGITITYAKDDSFLTFGIKNIYLKKQLTGYKAYIEHN